MTKTGYTLIAIGLFLILFNYGWINFSILSKPLVMPFIFILAGLFSIINSVFNLGDLGEVLSTIFTLLIIATIFANIFNFPSIRINPGNEALVNLSVSGLSASFTELNFSSSYGQVNVNYESNNQMLSESSVYSQNYSINNDFSEGNYDFSDIYGSNLIFTNTFGESLIINLASFNYSKINNNFGQTTLSTGKIFGEKMLIVDNSFGNVIIYIDKDASYIIDSNSNAFGTIQNNVGLASNDYSASANKIKIIVSNSFGTVEIYKQ